MPSHFNTIKFDSSSPPVDINGLYYLLFHYANDEELIELAKTLKCKESSPNGETRPGEEPREDYVWRIVKALYARYQTPLGYIFKNPTLDQMCDKIAKKMKLRDLQGAGWQKLHCLVTTIFEKILQAMPREEREQLLTKLWNSMSTSTKDKLNRELKIADLSAFIHSNEILIAHTVGLHMAREMAIFTASALLRVSLGTGLALTASTILSRGATLVLGPVGWALMAVSVNDLLSTNFKRLVPALLIVHIVWVQNAEGPPYAP